MANNDVKDSSKVVAPGDGPSTMVVFRRVRDERAITLAGHLLMAGVTLEKRVKSLVRVRLRT